MTTEIVYGATARVLFLPRKISGTNNTAEKATQTLFVLLPMLFCEGHTEQFPGDWSRDGKYPTRSCPFSEKTLNRRTFGFSRAVVDGASRKWFNDVNGRRFRFCDALTIEALYWGRQKFPTSFQREI